MASRGSPIIELRDIRRVFGPKANETVSLSSVSLTIHRGEFVAIIGPSGAGKSTLLNILGILDRPSSGSYLIDGVDVSTLSEAQRNIVRNERLGFVFQDSHMLLDDSAAANASLPLKVRGTSLASRRDRAQKTLTQLGLSHRSGERTINLSGGERQRVAIARAISTEPDIVLADEPTGALDTENSKRVIEHLRELSASGVTVIVITHDLTVAAAAQRQIRLVDGAVALQEQPDGVGDPPPAAAPTTPDTKRTRSLWRRVRDEFLDATSSQSSNPGRAALLLLAFVLGTGGLVGSVGIAQSAAVQVSTRLTEASLDEVVIRASNPDLYAEGFYFQGEDSAANKIAKLEGVTGVGLYAPLSNADAPVSLLPGTTDLTRGSIDIAVADAGYLRLMGATTHPSNSATLLNNEWSGRVALLGHDAAQTLGIESVGPGTKLWVRGEAVDVVGIISATGRAPELANSVILSPAAAVGIKPEDPRFVVRTEPGMPAAVAEAAPRAVSAAHPDTIRVETVADLRNLQIGVASDLSSLVGAVSVLLLLLASLTSGVTMYLSVQSRRSEIALRRAVGGSRASIWRIFTMEGLVLGLAGGISGAALGICAVVVVSVANLWTPITDPFTAVLGVVLGAVSGVLSAAYPALLAARADPALAIRG